MDRGRGPCGKRIEINFPQTTAIKEGVGDNPLRKFCLSFLQRVVPIAPR